MKARGTAAIVGAGIGGLAAAIALERSGYEVTVFEQADEIRPLGAALTIWPNGVRALRALGLGPTVDDPEITLGGGAVRRGDGSVIAEFDPHVIAERWGEPLLGFHREALHAALLEQLDSATLRLSTPVSGLSDNGLRLDGEDVPADLIVGADGLHSVIRDAVLGDGEPSDSGLVAYRGVVDWPHPVPAGEWWGERSAAGLLPLPDGRVYWYVTHPGEPSGPGEFALDFSSPVPEIVAASKSHLTHRLYDRPLAKRWTKENVGLLGDAAHPMLPFLGQGAGAALEDAVALGLATAESPEPTAALERYEQLRVKRANALVRGSRQAAKVAMARSRFAQRARNAALARLPDSVRLRQLDGYLKP